ncbi:hypothetical protein CWI38_0400p0010 [Hamiltosporidium tvaerminnensis]|uniref:Uncharacterized protein n=1 Tax=Hamiltosporidium tvaerminnensis TaxID=1176355 RepID=A0A4Q9M0E7_9MICR|nr:hypothetical protein CWI38_0830p0020 [Hamiltosporidium tvaerminnensis]TBU13540.1 hypothetical protein CWI38_0400p0010 [Hamiltosporidium tvaerminnensis]
MGSRKREKTTLLNFLAGKLLSDFKTKVQVLVNVKTRNQETWYKNLGYIDKDIFTHDDLTLKNLSYLTNLFYFQILLQYIPVKLKKQNNVLYRMGLKRNLLIFLNFF